MAYSSRANVQIRKILVGRGNTTISSNYTGVRGEITMDTDLKALRIHDGVQVGGYIMAGQGWVQQYVANAALGNVDLGQLANISLLLSNAATQQVSINNLVANAAIQSTNIANVVIQSNTAPDTATTDIWFNTVDGRAYASVNGLWIDANPTVIPSPQIYTGNLEISNIDITNVGNIVPAADVTYNLGSENFQWHDLWTNRIYLGDTPITVSNGTLLVNGNVIGAGTGTYGDSNVNTLFGQGVSWQNPEQNPQSIGGHHYSTTIAGNLTNNGFRVTNVVGALPEQNWTFNKQAQLVLPFGSYIDESFEYGPMTLTGLNLNVGNHSWNFGANGLMSLPDGITFNNGSTILSGSFNAGAGGAAVLSTYDGHNQVFTQDYDAGAGAGIWVQTSADGSTYYNWQFKTDGNVEVPGSIIPNANVTYSLGDSTHQWRDLWISNNTIYINSIPLSIAANNSLSVNGQPVVTYTNGNLTVGGTVVSGSGNPFDQNLNTYNAVSFASVGATVGYIAQINGSNPGDELVIQAGGTFNWVFHGNGNLAFPDNSLTIGNRYGSPTIQSADDLALQLVSSGENGLTDIIWINTPTEYTKIAGVVVNNPLFVGNADVGIITGDALGVEGGVTNVWNFDTTGNITFPDTTVQTTAWTGNISLSSLFDVDVTTTPPSVGYALKWDGTKWVAGTVGGGGGGISLTDLFAANVAASGNGYLAYNNVSGTFSFAPPNLSGYASKANVDTLDANVGSYQTWANANFGTSSYSDSNVAAYLLANPQSGTYSNTNVAAYLTLQNISAQIQSDYAQADTGNVAYIKNKPDLSVYATTTALQTLDANVGAYQVWANANVSSLQNQITGANTNIQNTSANIGSFYTWANANFATGSTYSNTNVAAYLSAQSIAPQIQSDWNQATVGNVAYIKNKPTAVSAFTNDSGYLTSATLASSTVTVNTANVAYFPNVTATSSSATHYPGLYNATTGNLATFTNSGLTYIPSSANLSTTGNIISTGNVYVLGGALRTTASTANVFNTGATTVNMAGGATIGTYIGNASGIVQLNGNVQGSTNGFAIGYRDIPQLSFTGNTTITVSDAGKHYYSTQSSNFTLTVANNTSQAFSTGAAVNIINQGTGTITIAPGVGVTMYLAGNSTAGSRTLSSYGLATLQKVATDTWFVVGVGLA